MRTRAQIEYEIQDKASRLGECGIWRSKVDALHTEIVGRRLTLDAEIDDLQVELDSMAKAEAEL